MSQIRDKKAYKKGIETKNPINAKSVQLIELHAFACDLVCLYLSESLDLLKVSILHIVTLLALVATGLLAGRAAAAQCLEIREYWTCS